MDWGNVAALAGIGMVSGLNQHKQDQKETEQRDYERARQQAQDKRTEETHAQTIQSNQFTLDGQARESAQVQRMQMLNDRIGQYQQFKSMNDVDSSAKLYVDTANRDNISNPNWNPNHSLSYVKDNDGTVSINVIDKNTGAVVQQARKGLGFDDFISATHQQINPTASYETQVSNTASKAKLADERDWELRKLGTENSAKYQLEGYKHQNALELEGIRQRGQTERTHITQDGQNTRSVVGASGKSTSSKAVASGVQGALTFAENNAPIFSFLQNDPTLYNLTMAMAGIESAGDPNALSYDKSSHGVMQLNKKYANGFAQQFGIQGDPINDPSTNVKTGAALIKHLYSKYGGNVELVAAAYNAGEPAIDKAVNSWKKSGGDGSWFDHLNLNQDARMQVYGHIDKYNQALSHLGFNANSSATPQQSPQVIANQKGKSTKAYVEGLGASAAGTISTVSDKMAKDLGVDAVAGISGGLQATQKHIIKFANSQDYDARFNAYNSIYTYVKNTVAKTEAGQAMTPQALNDYSKQKAAELVGASSSLQAGTWLKEALDKKNSKGYSKSKAGNGSNLSQSELDGIVGGVSVSSQSKQPANKPASNTKTAENPFYTSGIKNALKGEKGAMIPYRN